MLAGFKHTIGAAGYDLLLFASERPGNGFGDHSYLKRCRHHNVEGVVLMGVDPEDAEVRRLLRSEVPCVGVDVGLPGATARGVASDNEGGARLAVRHLYELGHRRIATITGLLESSPGSARLRGYRRELQALGLAFRDELIAYGDFYADSGRAGTAQLLALDEPPTAVFAASDMMALGVITRRHRRRDERAARSRRRRVRRHGARRPRPAAAHHVAAGPGRARRGRRPGTDRTDRRGARARAGPQLPVELVIRGSTAPPRAG